jgi:hypothetical protein
MEVMVEALIVQARVAVAFLLGKENPADQARSAIARLQAWTINRVSSRLKDKLTGYIFKIVLFTLIYQIRVYYFQGLVFILSSCILMHKFQEKPHAQ